MVDRRWRVRPLRFVVLCGCRARIREQRGRLAWVYFEGSGRISVEGRDRTQHWCPRAAPKSHAVELRCLLCGNRPRVALQKLGTACLSSVVLHLDALTGAYRSGLQMAADSPEWPAALRLIAARPPIRDPQTVSSLSDRLSPHDATAGHLAEELSTFEANCKAETFARLGPEAASAAAGAVDRFLSVWTHALSAGLPDFDRTDALRAWPAVAILTGGLAVPLTPAPGLCLRRVTGHERGTPAAAASGTGALLGPR